MANAQRGEVDVTVKDRTYTLAMDLNAMCELQAVLRPNDPESLELDDAFKKVVRMNPIYVRAFVWAMLRRHHKEVTLQGASDIVVDAGGMSSFFERIGTLLAFTQPDAQDQGAVKAAAPTGPTPAAAVAVGTGRASTSKRAKSA